MFWEVLLEFGDTLTPVGRCLLADQLNVQVRPLTRSIGMTRCCSPNNSGRHICHYVLWSKKLPFHQIILNLLTCTSTRLQFYHII